MNLRKSFTVAACCALVLAAVAAGARAGDPAPIAYGLEEGSGYEIGCFPPCKCPILHLPAKGTFDLTHAGFDGLFDNYAVTNVRWTVDGRPEMRVTGSGRYRIGGEFALQHQLTLDLELGDAGARRFDSGLVVGGREFPTLAVTVAIGRMFCYDTAFALRASPLVAAAPPRAGGSAGLRAAPNPFRSGTELRFATREPGAVEITVHDIHGREVRSIARGAPLGSGGHVVAWDGRRGDGSEAAAGLYFVRLVAGAVVEVRTVVKLP